MIKQGIKIIKRKKKYIKNPHVYTCIFMHIIVNLSKEIKKKINKIKIATTYTASRLALSHV